MNEFYKDLKKIIKWISYIILAIIVIVLIYAVGVYIDSKLDDKKRYNSFITLQNSVPVAKSIVASHKIIGNLLVNVNLGKEQEIIFFEIKDTSPKILIDINGKNYLLNTSNDLKYICKKYSYMSMSLDFNQGYGSITCDDTDYKPSGKSTHLRKVKGHDGYLLVTTPSNVSADEVDKHVSKTDTIIN